MDCEQEDASAYVRAKELKAFDETKTGVKGLIDSGIVNIPKIFVRPPEELSDDSNRSQIDRQVPVIDLDGIHGNLHDEIVDQLKSASETWGFFQVVNHGIPLEVLQEMIKGITKFHEGDAEMKKLFYSRDRTRKVRFNSNFDLYRSKAANWRDSLGIASINDLDPKEIPAVCRDSTIEYSNYVKELGSTLFGLVSEALGLKTEHLHAMECNKWQSVVGHYYPACPNPELTLGTSGHTDVAFITILLQDQIGGLQVLHENQWVIVQPIPGALVVNIGDLLQIISNGKFNSVEHRVVANNGVIPRISVACFFNGEPSKLYGPIRELISEDNPQLYKDFLISDFDTKFASVGLGTKIINFFKL